jgi:hypothetical protein
MNNKPNYRVRKQNGGTCWFHAFLTGFLLSKYGRVYLKDLVGTQSASTSYFCPMKTSHMNDKVKGLIRKYLNSGVRNNKNNINTFIGKNKNVTKNSGLSIRDMFRLYNNFFGNDIKRQKQIVRFFKNKPTIISELNPPEVTGVLSHALISLSSFHFISGIINKKDEAYIFDSASLAYKKIDWRTPDGITQIKKTMEPLGLPFDVITVYRIYVPDEIKNKEVQNTAKLKKIENNTKVASLYFARRNKGTLHTNNRGSINNRMIKEITNGQRNWQLENRATNVSPMIRLAKNNRIIELVQALNFKNLNGKIIHGKIFTLERNENANEKFEHAKANAVGKLKKIIKNVSNKIIRGNSNINRSVLNNKSYNGPWVRKAKTSARKRVNTITIENLPS